MASKQVLTIHAAPSSPVKETDGRVLAANMQALANLGRAPLKAIAAYSLTFLLQANGKTDYRTNLPQLVQDAKIFFGVFELVAMEENLQMLLIQTALNWNAGYTANNALGTDVWAIYDKAKLLAAYDEETLNKILLFERFVDLA